MSYQAHKPTDPISFAASCACQTAWLASGNVTWASGSLNQRLRLERQFEITPRCLDKPVQHISNDIGSLLARRTQITTHHRSNAYLDLNMAAFVKLKPHLGCSLLEFP